MVDTGAENLLEQFDRSPSRQLRVERLEALPAELRSGILANDRAREYLDGHLRDELDWGEPMELASDPFLETIAIPQEELHQLARFIGATLAATEIRETVSGQVLRILKQSGAGDLIDFALFRVPLMKVPAVKAPPMEGWQTEPLTALAGTGARSLLMGCGGYPVEIARRVALKLELANPGDPPHNDDTEGFRRLATTVRRAMRSFVAG